MRLFKIKSHICMYIGDRQDTVIGAVKTNTDGYYEFYPVPKLIGLSMRDLVDIPRIIQELNTTDKSTIIFKPLG